MANVFGALNRFISRLDSDNQAQKQDATQGAYGFQVLRNSNADLPLDPWFDFIIGINGRTLVWSYQVMLSNQLLIRTRIVQTRTSSLLRSVTAQARQSALESTAQR